MTVERIGPLEPTQNVKKTEKPSKAKSRVIIVAEHVEFKPIRQPAPGASAEGRAEAEAGVAEEAAAMVF